MLQSTGNASGSGRMWSPVIVRHTFLFCVGLIFASFLLAEWHHFAAEDFKFYAKYTFMFFPGNEELSGINPYQLYVIFAKNFFAQPPFGNMTGDYSWSLSEKEQSELVNLIGSGGNMIRPVLGLSKLFSSSLMSTSLFSGQQIWHLLEHTDTHCYSQGKRQSTPHSINRRIHVYLLG